MNGKNEAPRAESWYDKSLEQIERHFSADRGRGLDEAAAAKARRTYGANHVYPSPRKTFTDFRRLIPTDYASLLLLAAVAAAAIFELPIASGVIVIILFLNYAAAVFTFIKAQIYGCFTLPHLSQLLLRIVGV